MMGSGIMKSRYTVKTDSRGTESEGGLMENHEHGNVIPI